MKSNYSKKVTKSTKYMLDFNNIMYIFKEYYLAKKKKIFKEYYKHTIWASMRMITTIFLKYLCNVIFFYSYVFF